MDMKNYLFESYFFLGIVAIIAGVVVIGLDVKFSIDKFQGKYKRVSAFIERYEKYVTEDSEGNEQVTYYTIYEFKENGNIGNFKGAESYDLFRNRNIGKRVFLYRNKKTNKMREAPKFSILYGVVCILMGLFLIYCNHRKNIQRIDYFT